MIAPITNSVRLVGNIQGVIEDSIVAVIKEVSI